MSLQILEGLVLNVMDSRSCFHLACYSCKISLDISLFSVCILLATSCEESWHLRWFLVRILCRMFLLNPGLNCLIAPVVIWSLGYLMIMSVRRLVAVLMSGKLSILKSLSSVSMLFVNAPQSALL